VTLINGTRGKEWIEAAGAEGVAEFLGLDGRADGLIGWDVFDAVLNPGEVILLLSWSNSTAAQSFEKKGKLAQELRLRRVRVVRDYSMFDRREAPQYYPEIKP
jgi:hypothetical protein